MRAVTRKFFNSLLHKHFIAFLSIPAVASVIFLETASIHAEIDEGPFVEVTLEDGRPVGAETLRVAQGQAVTVRWRSDTPTTLHLHGYDVTTETGPDRPGEMTFRAHAAGRFPVEVHEPDGGHRTVVYIEVHPE